MANLRNEFEFRSALLTALGQEHTEAEAKNEDTWRRKMLDGLGVEYNQNDVNQFGLFREKLIEGVTNYSGGGGGGSSDFSTAKIDVTINGEDTFYLADAITVCGEKVYWAEGFQTMSYTMVLYKGTYEGTIQAPEGYKISSATGTGGVTVSKSTSPYGPSIVNIVNITGDGTLTVNITRA